MNRPFITRRPGQMAHQGPILGLLAGLLLLPTLLAGCPGSLGAGFPAPPTGGGSTGGAPQVMGTGGAPSSGSSGGSGGTVTACDAPTQVFAKSCAIMGCHLMLFPPDLSMATAAGLKAMIAGTSTAPCMGQNLINAANPATSPLILRVTGKTCGPQMPDKDINPAVTYLTQTDMDCLTSWVTANAGN